MDEIKCLESGTQGNGQCTRQVKKRVQAECSGWRQELGVIYDAWITPRVKRKVYNVVVRPEALLKVAELKFLRFSLGVM